MFITDKIHCRIIQNWDIEDEDKNINKATAAEYLTSLEAWISNLEMVADQMLLPLERYLVWYNSNLLKHSIEEHSRHKHYLQESVRPLLKKMKAYLEEEFGETDRNADECEFLSWLKSPFSDFLEALRANVTNIYQGINA